jgi:hypothetical protein
LRQAKKKKKKENISKMSETTPPSTGNKQPPPPITEPVKVRVICEGTLGSKLLAKGQVTDDPDYVALLKTASGRRKVEKVKQI